MDDQIQRGKDARLAKWQARLRQATIGTQGYVTAKAMVDLFSKDYEEEYLSKSRISDHVPVPTGMVYALDVSHLNKPVTWEDLGYTKTDGITYSDKVTTTRNEETDMMGDLNATAEQLEQAALNLAAKAQAIREFDAREPEGDEPVISWRQSYGGSPPYRSDTREYTYVAIKAENGLWYLTGRNTKPYTWRELGAGFQAVAEGRFWLCTGWAWQGEPEDNED